MDSSLKKISYNWEIDVLKFIFAVIVAVFHCSRFDPAIPVLSRGYLAVEFFFIVSGYFMAQKIKSSNPQSTGTFLLKKIGPIYPVYIGAFLVAVLCRIAPFNLSLFEYIKRVMIGGLEILVLQEFGFDVGTFYNGVTWYISAMMIAMAILYPLYSKYRSYFLLGGGALLVALCCYALLLHNFERIAAGSAWAGVFKFRVVRAFAGLSLGVFCNTCCGYVKNNFIPTKFGQFFFFCTKLVVLTLTIALIHFASLLKFPSRFDIIIAFFEFFLVFLVFSGLGNIRIPEKYHFLPKFLGLSSLYIYFNHRGVIWFIQCSKFDWDYGFSMLVFTIGTVFASVLCYFLSKLFVWACKNLSVALFKNVSK